jgi:hypothetical protein
VRRKLGLAALLLLLPPVASVGLAGCGSSSGDGASDKSSSAKLSASEQAAVRASQSAIQSYCRTVLLYLERRTDPPTQGDTARAYAGVDRLAAIARAKPSAPQGRSGETVRDLMADTAEDLQGANCADNVVGRIDQALASLPAE